ncbi:OLC1v1001908C1 [Oldenlandia corymbosa var. corymbosa]|uniref:OLC1v1001908C1 n=1 Tax=Oldenlandia corymbosa var. corymbosa TaxID=529605 RepID=A0AAV1D741_OLDCO|nr:OLC1v1001908C1 [Oldenlandia corymbosa var. corymbosa]
MATSINSAKPTLLLLKSNLKRIPLFRPSFSPSTTATTPFKLSVQLRKIPPSIDHQIINSNYNANNNKLSTRFDLNNSSATTCCDDNHRNAAGRCEVMMSYNHKKIMDADLWSKLFVGFVAISPFPLAALIARQIPGMFSHADALICVLFGYILIGMVYFAYLRLAPTPYSVLKLQVGFLVSGRSLQRDLDQIAKIASTSTRRHVLTETTLALLRRLGYCSSGYSSANVGFDIIEVFKQFDQLSNKERVKFDEVTLVDVNNIRIRSSSRQRTSESSEEYIVVTILVVAEGKCKLHTINSSSDLNEVLQNLASLPSSITKAVEVSWTPLVEGNRFSEQDFLKDYPLLRPL